MQASLGSSEAYDFERPAPADDARPSKDEQALERLNALGKALEGRRTEAVNGRAASGIEEDWIGDEEYYEGIDDANRNDAKSWRTRPVGQAELRASGTRSTVFINITRPYVDAAAARVADMLLPTDDRAWSLKPTPIPELLEIAEGRVLPEMSAQLQQTVPADQLQAVTQKVIDQAKQIVDEASKRAEKAEKRIEDWHVECQFHAEVRTVIEDSSRIGTGILKGPVPIKKKTTALVDANEEGQQQPQTWFQKLVAGVKGIFNAAQVFAKKLVIKEEIKPASMRVSAWNLFPDPSCGENIHNGAYVWERDYLTKKKLKDLKGTPGYIDQQIDLCLSEDPQRPVADKDQGGASMPRVESKNEYEIWYYHGLIEKDDLEAAGCDCSEVEQDKYMCIPAIITMVNGRVIKAALSPLDNGEFPYDVMCWQRRQGHWAGIGVGRQVRTPQRVVNAAARNLMDNAGLSAGGQFLIKDGVVTPADGVYAMTPRKVWRVSKDYEGPVSDAFTFVNITSLQADLMEIIKFGLKIAEDVTGLPMLLQGQQGKAPDTLGGMQMLSNNASTVLRRIARLFDDFITEPHIRRYYAWLMQYGNDDEKGDFSIDARGSSALVERDLENQTIAEMGKIVKDPAFGVDPKKWFAEFCKSRKLDPKRVQYTDEEWKQVQENMAKVPPDPRIQAAEINAKVKMAMQERDQAFEAQQNDLERQNNVTIELIDERMLSTEISAQERDTLNKIKGKLGETAIKIKAQRELSAQKQVMSPPTEPAGRAPAGQAFQR